LEHAQKASAELACPKVRQALTPDRVRRILYRKSQGTDARNVPGSLSWLAVDI
jgi:hypothetical protein